MIGRMEIPTINPVVKISTAKNIIIIPHAMLILIRDLKIETSLILVVWKGRAETNTIAKLSKKLCMQYRNNYLMVGSDIPKTSKLLFMWRT
jgi:hypothetical protein